MSVILIINNEIAEYCSRNAEGGKFLILGIEAHKALLRECHTCLRSGVNTSPIDFDLQVYDGLELVVDPYVLPDTVRIVGTPRQVLEGQR